MGFLTGLFQQSASELPIAVDVLKADSNVEPGQLYRVEVSDNPLVIALRPHSQAEVAGLRIGVKVFVYKPPTARASGGALTIGVPEGQLIESDTGDLAAGVMYSETPVGMYREWLCDNTGVWLLVNRVDPL